MDPKKQQKLTQAKVTKILNKASPEKPEAIDFPKQQTSKELQLVLSQRKEQRDKILVWLLALTVASFTLLVVLSVMQAYVRLTSPMYTVFTGSEFQILAVSVFGEILGIVYIISKSLWDDSTYIDKL